MNTIFLNIGHGKTGTSFLQFVLAKNDKYLKGKGIQYENDLEVARDA